MLSTAILQKAKESGGRFCPAQGKRSYSWQGKRMLFEIDGKQAKENFEDKEDSI